jgi:hypothetical protein
MSDPISVSAIIISSITAVGTIITALHIKRLNSGCLNCECSPGTPLARSPTVNKPPIIIMQQPPEIKSVKVDGPTPNNTGSANC